MRTWNETTFSGTISVKAEGVELAVPHASEHPGCGLVLPPQIANEDQGVFLYFTLFGNNMTGERKNEWMKYQDNYNSFGNSFLVYTDENE